MLDGTTRRLIAGALGMLAAMPAVAWELAGEKQLALQARDGSEVPIGTVEFTPEGSASRFQLHLDHHRFKDYFLSMKEFKCLESSEEIQCHVPYPYRNPGTVSRGDLRWLEHSLLFLFKRPKEFGAKLWNGLYYRMEITDQGIVGTLQAVDLNQIGSPPDDLSVPPYQPEDRSEIAAGSRWFERLLIR